MLVDPDRADPHIEIGPLVAARDRVLDRYDEAFALARGTELLETYVGTARALELVATAMREPQRAGPRVLPIAPDGTAPGSSIPPSTGGAVEDAAVSAVRDALAPGADALECDAVARFLGAARAARRGFDVDATRTAVTRLRAYDDDRIGECVRTVRRGELPWVRADPTLAPYVAGELDGLPGLRPDANAAPRDRTVAPRPIPIE